MELLTKSPAIGKIALMLLAPCVALILSTAQASGIYKWVDEQGNVHYSQDPQGQAAEELKLKIPKSSGGDSSSAQGDHQDAQSADKASSGDAQAKAEKQAAAEDQKEAKAKNCQISMKRLATITAGGRLYEVNEKGQRLYWDDDTRKAKLEEAQKNVDEWCGQE
jgi:hypothetical protein